MSVALTEREIRVGGRPVRHRATGEGPPLVLVHGLGGSTRWWEPVLPALAERHAVHLVDLPGFGAMARRGRRIALAETGAWLLAWLDAAGIARPALAGHSMGAAIAVRAAAEAPDRIDRLVLVAPAGLLARSLLGYGLPLATALRRAPPRLVSILVRDAVRAGPLTLLRSTLEVVADDARADLRRVTVPTLVVAGERDPIVPAAVCDVVREELPAARLVVLPRAGHVPMFDRPDAFAETLLEFLA